MTHLPTPPQPLDRDFLTIRARLVELAAALDRIDRAGGGAAADSRLDKIRQSLDVLGGPTSNRAAEVQMIFSLPYSEDWRK
ncbi:MAG: hypothetical protein ABSF26_16820 [Thermoguttaceae bacterium]|jgi:hypothetical protein